MAEKVTGTVLMSCGVKEGQLVKGEPVTLSAARFAELEKCGVVGRAKSGSQTDQSAVSPGKGK
ncbi:hypothetical protein ACEK07_04395 [Alcanivoracaceae bacterium MT1]